MYKSLRIIRITVSLAAMLAPAAAITAGWDSIFGRMQIMTAILSGSVLWLIAWIAVTLLCGRIYCSTVCPLGTLQDCISTAARVLTPRRRRRGYRYHAPLNRLRLTVLVTVMSCMLCGWMLIPMHLDPYSAYASIVRQFVAAPLTGCGRAVPFTLSTFAIALTSVAVTAGFAFRRGRLLCNTICPVGTFLGAISDRALFHADINTDKCINCGECERVCKAECIRLPEHTIDASRCVVCFKCMGVCPNDAITYRSGRHRLSMPLMQPTATAPISSPSTSENVFRHETISPAPERDPRKRD